jgi:predicted DNA-binding protein (MmcQ/YjbR family)
MDIQYFREYCLQKNNVEESFPFGEETMVFKVSGKIFALAGLDEFPPRVNLKCDPERCVELRENYPESIIPGYHMNKKHWNTVYIEGDLDLQFLKSLIDHSYDLVFQSLPKKLRNTE